MSFEPTLFPSTMYETADQAVLLCHSALNANGYKRLAQQLECALPMNDVALGLLARDTLRRALPVVDKSCKPLVVLALSTVDRALEESAQAGVALHALFCAVAA